MTQAGGLRRISSAETSSRTATEPTVGLMATRRLGVLDELGVPYDVAGSGGPWASVSAGDPGRSLLWFVGGDGETAQGWTAGPIRIWGQVAPESAVADLVSTLPGRWTRETAVVDRSGNVRSGVWRSDRGSTVLPFDPDESIANLRSERYRLDGGQRRSLTAAARRAYYAARPLIPRPGQIALRRGFSRIQARTKFPRWPSEPTLHDLNELVRQAVADAAGHPVPYIESWPKGRSWALVLTHDVETGVGRDAIDGLRSVEQTAGYRSSWNLVPERYHVDDLLVARLKAAGCEVGVHGLRHDGRDMASLRTLESRLPEIRRWATRWGAQGYRSPATHRVWEWMPKLGFDYDSSYPDSDPYEPMAGGCCSWLPFFNDQMVELPITLPQDHTVFVILRRDESLWREKAELLRRRGGMALIITHPDYMLRADRLRAYARLLAHFQDDATAWKALPSEVSDWWRRRAATALRPIGGRWRAVGPAAAEVSIAFTQPGR
jgi:hypothetical protein